jgi:LuxR family maltose regulon positive regulatory protein
MQQASPEAVLTSLIIDLDALNAEIVLVLDDYQFITSPAVNTQLAFFIEHCLHTLHLLIATRSDPPLSLARLRAGGQMIELRSADLRFTPGEANLFLNDILGLHLKAGVVAALEERTEGWIAGLQMAALSMRDRKDVDAFIAGFSGTNRYILDYLLEEVLSQQPAEIQHFLLYTSILKRLTAPLCDAVLGNKAGSIRKDDDQSSRSEAHFYRQSASILEYLERENLFLTPLDDDRMWYRYHHLFADLLHARLAQTYPDLAPQLHERASAWLEQAGNMVEAVDHAIAANAPDLAARLVEQNTTRLLAQGELNALKGWVEILPAELRLRSPWLCIHQAYAILFAAQTALVEHLLTLAETIAAPRKSVRSRGQWQQRGLSKHSYQVTIWKRLLIYRKPVRG